MTRFFAVTSVALILICVTVKCQPQPDDVESLSIQNDEDELSDASDLSPQARSYMPGAYIRPGSGMKAPIKFVNCYSCVDCPKVLYNTTTKYCPYTNDPTKHNKCVVYGEKYIQMKKLWYIRGCASERGSCADIKRGHEHSPSVKLSFCAECEGDHCNINGVSRSTIDLTTAFLVVVLYPVFGKFTLS